MNQQERLAANLPKVSIIIPVYNVELYIVDCLSSVMQQTYVGPMECILVDDCGTDRSMEIAEEMVAQYDGTIDFKVLRHEHNQGVSAARNSGINASKGDYVFFLDSDDWIAKDCIERLAAPLQTKRYEMVVGDFDLSVDLPKRSHKLTEKGGEYTATGPIFEMLCNKGVYVMAWNKLLALDYLNKYGLRFDVGRIFEDDILSFDFCCTMKSLYVVNAVTYHYRVREESIMRNFEVQERWSDWLAIIESVAKKLPNYQGLSGVYDLYFHWLKRVYGILLQEKGELEDKSAFLKERCRSVFKVIPNVRCLKDKGDRLLYFACKRNPTIKNYKYAKQVLPNTIKGRAIKKALGYLPYRPFYK